MNASDILFDELKAAANHKALKSIENLKAACDYLDNLDGAKRPKIPITIRDVGAFTEQLGSPTTPSIRNKPKYVEYIRARADEQKFPPVAERVKPAEYKTGNLEADSLLYAKDNKIRILERQLGALRSAIANGNEYDLQASINGERRLALSAGAELVVPAVSPLNPELRETLAKIVDPTILAMVGLALENGRIKCPDRNSREFLGKKDVERILRAIKWNEDNPERGTSEKTDK
jgi:hypothetical protein